MEHDQVSRPKKVGTAVRLLYLSLGIGVLRSIMEPTVHAQMGSPASGLFVRCLALGIMLLLTYMIGKGRNWARMTFLVSCVIGAPLCVLPLLQSLAVNRNSGLLGIGQMVIQIIALIFLFQKTASQWFSEIKAKK